MPYHGRFAPSPTGPLHFGSLVAALASYLDARRNAGQWLVRMEDLDRPREVPGAADSILRTLEAFGLTWDGEVLFQSRRDEAYQAAAEALRAIGLLYPCACSRKQIMARGRKGAEGIVYPGNCREGMPPGSSGRSLRVRTTAREITLQDRIQGPLTQSLEREVGDFVIHRADGLFAYQLAVVVDDAWQGISDVVRGADLLLSTPRQIYLQELLGLPRPNYAHLPLAVDEAGRKLSKQRAAQPVSADNPAPALYAALKHLGQSLPPERPDRPDAILEWAVAHWAVDAVPPVTAVPAGQPPGTTR
jgi:glutamyl-Q tRNA(Asp) synthetase